MSDSRSTCRSSGVQGDSWPPGDQEKLALEAVVIVEAVRGFTGTADGTRWELLVVRHSGEGRRLTGVGEGGVFCKSGGVQTWGVAVPRRNSCVGEAGRGGRAGMALGAMAAKGTRRGTGAFRTMGEISGTVDAVSDNGEGGGKVKPENAGEVHVGEGSGESRVISAVTLCSEL